MEFQIEIFSERDDETRDQPSENPYYENSGWDYPLYSMEKQPLLVIFPLHRFRRGRDG